MFDPPLQTTAATVASTTAMPAAPMPSLPSRRAPMTLVRKPAATEMNRTTVSPATLDPNERLATGPAAGGSFTAAAVRPRSSEAAASLKLCGATTTGSASREYASPASRSDALRLLR